MTHTQEQIDAARLASDLRMAAKVMREKSTFPTGQSIMIDAAKEIERLTADLDAMSAKDTPKRKMKITHYPEGFDGQGSVVFDSDTPAKEVTVQEAARVILGAMPKVFTRRESIEMDHARIKAQKGGHKCTVVDREAFIAALRALSEGEA